MTKKLLPVLAIVLVQYQADIDPFRFIPPYEPPAPYSVPLCGYGPAGMPCFPNSPVMEQEYWRRGQLPGPEFPRRNRGFDWRYGEED